jgi:hypothetical protein
VGIKIYNASGSAINLLPNLASTGTGNTRGWYAYTDLTSLVSSGSSNIYSGDFFGFARSHKWTNSNSRDSQCAVASGGQFSVTHWH